MWFSIDPRNASQVPYDDSTSRSIEKAFQDGKDYFQLNIGSTPFWLNFAEMRQYNATGGSRTVRRVETAVKTAADAPSSSAIDLYFKLKSDGFPGVSQSLQVAEEHLSALRNNLRNRDYRLPRIDPRQWEPILNVYNVLIAALPSFVDRYQGTADDLGLLRLRVGDPVPEYFANVKMGSIFRRKVLSVLGLRNLVVYGFEVFNQMIDCCFNGDPSQSSKNGLGRMKYLTGNTVDLDTIVLNSAASFNQLKRLGEISFASEVEFSSSSQCREMVLATAAHHINEFVDVVGLTAAERKKRNLVVGPGPIHVATTNSDRGKHTVWHYRQGDVSTFHVNVPNVPDVIGSVIAAPFHLVKGFLLHMERHDSEKNPFEHFFENCVSDSCFNGKWKAIESFIDELVNQDTIFAVLNKLQAENQDKFSRIVTNDHEDRRNEQKEMCRLVKFHRLVGVDASKRLRPITELDVAEWIRQTS